MLKKLIKKLVPVKPSKKDDILSNITVITDGKTQKI